MVVNKLKDELDIYQKITRNLLKSLEEEDYDALDGLLSDRESVISSINAMSYSKDEFNKICSELEIVLLQDNLTQEMHKKSKEVKNAISDLAKRKSANKSYNNKFNVDALYINKEL